MIGGRLRDRGLAGLAPRHTSLCKRPWYRDGWRLVWHPGAPLTTPLPPCAMPHARPGALGRPALPVWRDHLRRAHRGEPRQEPGDQVGLQCGWGSADSLAVPAGWSSDCAQAACLVAWHWCPERCRFTHFRTSYPATPTPHPSYLQKYFTESLMEGLDMFPGFPVAPNSLSQKQVRPWL